MDCEVLAEPLPLLGICNLCLYEGAVKNMLVPQKQDDSKELYADMLLKCFSIDITILELGDTKNLICNGCIQKLRDCVVFKENVETSLNTLEASVKTLRLQEVKQEVNDDIDVDDEDYGFDDPDDLDYIVKKETTTEKKTRRKKIIKKRPVITMAINKDCGGTKERSVTYKNTETLLAAGLFPFKMKKNNIFACAICSEKSFEIDTLKDHVFQHSIKNIHCAYRKMILSNSHRFRPFAEVFRCKLCAADISNYEELKKHIELCARLKLSYKWNALPFTLDKDQLDCPICKKRFLNFVSLNTHMNAHYPNYVCENCGKAFASKARLRGHMRTHEIGEFACRYCDAVFDKVTKRENHVSKEHKSGVRYACKRCKISLSSFYARQKHLAEVHDEELKRYKCKACPQSYITPGHLSSHVRRDHLNERNHKCEKCDLAFYTKNALKMHMIKHGGERIHSCPICQKSYQRKKTLREHMRIHDNDKRFVCPVCGRAFTQKCTLKGHLKVHDRKIDVDEKIGSTLHTI